MGLFREWEFQNKPLFFKGRFLSEGDLLGETKGEDSTTEGEKTWLQRDSDLLSEDQSRTGKDQTLHKS